jgi:speckle-type POZ protein
MPSAAATSGEPSRSASSIIADTRWGYHILKIDGYSLTKVTPTGEYLKSHPFTLGGHRWFIRYYPNGKTSDVKDHISIYLHLDETVAKAVKLRCQFSLGDKVHEPPMSVEWVRSLASNQCLGYPSFVEREELERSKYLKDDCFIVRCDIVIVNEFCATEETAADAPPRFVLVPPSSLHQHLGDLLRTEKGADVIFDVGGQTFAAHRCVLAARSPVFSAELFGTMKESDTANVIRVDDMEAQVFKALLYFVYTDTLPATEKTDEYENEQEEEEERDTETEEEKEEDLGDEQEEEEEKDAETEEEKEEELGDEEDDQDEEEDVMSQHLLVAADRYNLERLKLLCEEKLCRYIDVNTVATILTLAEQHHCEGLKKACFYFLKTPTNLRTAMATDDFKHLSRSSPAVMEELIAMLVT